jgi:hypothetical protein
LTIGPFQEDDGILFGPALVRAYEIERSLALWPRCVIDPFLIARHDIYPDGVWNKHQYILLGDDGLPFLDYLGYTFGHYFYNWIEERMKDNGHKHNENPEHLALTVLHGHKNAIFQAVRKAARKKESASTLFTKFFPLAAYHNKVIERFIDVSRPGRLDDLKKFAIEGGLEPAIVDNLEKEIVDDDASRWRSELIDLNSLLNEMWSTEIIPS